MKLKKTLVVTVILGISFMVFSFVSPLDLEAAEGTDIGIVGIEWGSTFGYNLNESDFGPGQYFGINLAIANNMVAGFNIITGDEANVLNYKLLKFSYFIGGKKKPIGIDVLVGGGQLLLLPMDIAAGAGLFLNLFQKQAEDITTVLKLKVGYIITAAYNEKGSLLFTLSGQIGL